ncbi:hypothetical protein LCE31_17870, partial [Streptomyces sp. 8L]
DRPEPPLAQPQRPPLEPFRCARTTHTVRCTINQATATNNTVRAVRNTAATPPCGHTTIRIVYTPNAPIVPATAIK